MLGLASISESVFPSSLSQLVIWLHQLGAYCGNYDVTHYDITHFRWIPKSYPPSKKIPGCKVPQQVKIIHKDQNEYAWKECGVWLLHGLLDRMYVTSKHPVRVGCQSASPCFPFLIHPREKKKTFRGLNWKHLHLWQLARKLLVIFFLRSSNLKTTATITADFRFLGCHSAYFALKCQILISNWNREKLYMMANSILRKVKLLSELSVPIKVHLWIHHVDRKISISFSNAQSDRIR